MRKYLTPIVGLFLLAGLAYGIAQNINKAIQLSQDPTGSFGVDSNNNTYFPAHILTVGPTPVPTTTLGLVGSTVTGTDTAGIIVGSAVASSAGGLVFKNAYLTTPYCLAVSQSPVTSPIVYSSVATGINFTTFTGTVTVNYFCTGSK